MEDSPQTDDINKDDIDKFPSVEKFLYAERTGDWNFYLHTIYEMLTLLAATGHLHCTSTTSTANI